MGLWASVGWLVWAVTAFMLLSSLSLPVLALLSGFLPPSSFVCSPSDEEEAFGRVPASRGGDSLFAAFATFPERSCERPGCDVTWSRLPGTKRTGAEAHLDSHVCAGGLGGSSQPQHYSARTTDPGRGGLHAGIGNVREGRENFCVCMWHS